MSHRNNTKPWYQIQRLLFQQPWSQHIPVHVNEHKYLKTVITVGVRTISSNLKAVISGTVDRDTTGLANSNVRLR